MKLLINLMIVLINYFYLLGLSPVLTNYLVSGKYKHTPDKGTMDHFFLSFRNSCLKNVLRDKETVV